MRTLDLYLARSVLIGIIIAILVIVAIDWLGDLFYQAGRIKGDVNFSDMFIMTLLDIPYKLFEFLPSALLIGALLSLGQFAANSELVAIGTGGYSRLRVGIVSCVTGLIVIIVSSVLVELYSPFGDRLLLQIEQDNQDGSVLVASDESYWVRDNNRFVHVGSAVSSDLLGNVSIYHLDELGRVAWIARADNAIRKDSHWELENFRRSGFDNDEVIVQQEEVFEWQEGFLGNFLKSINTDPFKLSINRLASYIDALEENHLDASLHYVALYKKFAVPVTGLAMMMLALPLVFRPRQLGGIGQRLFVGVVIALIAYVIIEAFTNAVVVYQIPPLVGTFLPALIIFALSVFAFKFTR
jgi:lipopolysaccharide export system permease protein